MELVTISSQGQITIPKKLRELIKTKFFMIKIGQEKQIILNPVEVTKQTDNETSEMHQLSESSLDFWNNDADDIYQNFYGSK